MKCDKHGIEMEWRGSLMKGGMYCVGCELDSAKVELHFDPSLPQGIFDAYAAEAPRAPNPAPPSVPSNIKWTSPARSLYEATLRTNDAIRAQSALGGGASLAYCPYCKEDVDIGHFKHQDEQGRACFKEYCRDMDIVQRGHV